MKARLLQKISASACLCLAATLHANAQPNILFIAVDDLKPVIGAYGESVPTPAIDRIAAQGTTFLNAHCQQAVCGPSRASLMTGKLPDNTQVWDLKTKIRAKNPDTITIPQHFKANGYTSVGVGKIFDPRSVDKGADKASWSIPYAQTWTLKYNEETGKPTASFHSPEAKALAGGINNWGQLNKKLFAAGAWQVTEALDLPDDAYDDGAIANYALEQLPKLAANKEPFFLAVGFKKPHLPFIAPKKYWDRIDPASIQLAEFQQFPEGGPSYAVHDSHELRSYNGVPPKGPLDEATQRRLIHGYYACVAYIDTQIGKLLDELDTLGIADNTIIVLWGDHGFHLGDHGMWCKHTNYEQATRSPLIISAPASTAQTTTMPAELTDIFPTLCEMAGIPAPENLDGVSLAATVDNADNKVRQFALSQWPKGDKMGYALRTERFRFVAWYETGKNQGAKKGDPIDATELYDYETDPLETRNLVNDPEYKKVAEAMQQQLARLAER